MFWRRRRRRLALRRHVCPCWDTRRTLFARHARVSGSRVKPPAWKCMFSNRSICDPAAGVQWVLGINSSQASPLSSEGGFWWFSGVFSVKCLYFFYFLIIRIHPASKPVEIGKVFHIPSASPFTKRSKQLLGIFYLSLNSNSFSSPDSHILHIKLTLLDL